MSKKPHAQPDAAPRDAPEAGAGRPGLVMDPNLALDWLLFGNPRVAPLVHALQSGRLRWFSCTAMRDELARMLRHPSLSHWGHDADGALATHDALADLWPAPLVAPRDLPRCSDPDDQVFAELAVVAGARWLVSHDRALLRMARPLARRGVEVLTPARWPGTVELPAGSGPAAG